MKAKWITWVCSILSTLCLVVLVVGIILGKANSDYTWRCLVGTIAALAAIAWGYRAVRGVGTKNNNGFNFLAMFVIAMANFFA